MNKKIKILFSAVLIALVFLLVFSGVGFAGSNNNSESFRDNWNNENGFCRGRGSFMMRKIVFNDALYNLLDMTEEEIQAELQEGKSLVEIALEQGIDEPTLVETLLAQVKAKLEQAVANEDITQKVADNILQREEERISHMENAQCIMVRERAREGCPPGHYGSTGMPRNHFGMGAPCPRGNFGGMMPGHSGGERF